jgi:D-xylose 1-dehydrogenase (NADP+, D-xylono-1,5-lactone-forming)
MSRTIRWGLLSTANINEKIIAGASQVENAEIHAVGSRDGARAESYARKHGIPRAHGSYEELLADDEVDAVYISLPNLPHHEWTLKAIAAGKHVLCEKPYSRRAADVEEAFDAAERAGVVLSEAFMWRHHPQTAQLLELLPQVGTVQTVRSRFSFRLHDTTDIRMSAELEGGSLMDVGCYCVSAARLVAGEEPESVVGVQELGVTGVDIRFYGVLSFPGGAVSTFACGFTTQEQGIEVVGTDGSLTVADPWHVKQPGIDVEGRRSEVARVDSYGLQLKNVGEAIEGGALLLGREDALGQARTIEALYRSAETGAAVSLAAAAR